MPMVVVPFVETRVPNYAALTYEEHNERHGLAIAHHRAPDIPRQSEIAPVKAALMPTIFFYDETFESGATNNLGPKNFGDHMTGFHTVIANVLSAAGGSWISSPRGRMIGWRERRTIERRQPVSFGSEVEPL